MLVRCTAKALGLIGRAEYAPETEDSSEWYLNRLWFNRRKCLLVVHATTLYPAFVPDIRKSDLQPFGAWAVMTAVNALATKAWIPACSGRAIPIPS
jgi:hypothetical protein